MVKTAGSSSSVTKPGPRASERPGMCLVMFPCIISSLPFLCGMLISCLNKAALQIPKLRGRLRHGLV